MEVHVVIVLVLAQPNFKESSYKVF